MNTIILYMSLFLIAISFILPLIGLRKWILAVCKKQEIVREIQKKVKSLNSKNTTTINS